jgi:transcriptional regulator with GAF, ATPase, and Fis domain
MQYSGPGNVRELENAIKHAIVMGLTDEILPEDQPNALLEEQPSGLDAARHHNTLNQTKKQLVLTALDQTSGNQPSKPPPPGNPPQIPAPEPEFEIRREATGVSTAALARPFVDSALK